MTAVNSWRVYLNSAPHVTLAALNIASANFVPFLTAYYVCSLNCNFLSKITLRYRASFDGSIVVPVISMAASVLRFLFLVK